MHDNLHVLRLPGFAIRACDGEGYKVIPIISYESRWNSQTGDGVATLVQRVARRGGGIGSLSGVLSIFNCAHEKVLIWVKLLRAYVAGVPAPWASRCWCTDRRSASRAANFALLLATAFAKSPSLHREQTLCTVLCIADWVAKQDR